jgi:GT2 family glycosyltransferase/glycosyltransferase involved in cell wall biosynthesis
LRTTLDLLDPLFVSAPNDGGLLYAHRHLLMPMLREDATGLSPTGDGLLWCVQTAGSPLLREVRQGQFNSIALAAEPLDLHDVLVDASGTYAVFTQTNEVVRLDEAFKVVERWSFGNEPDSAHVNCIALVDGRLVASMFGPFTTYRGYKGLTRQAGRVVDVRTGEILIDGLSQPHSLVHADERLWLCSSEDRAVHIYDHDYRLQQKIALPGYTRGLAVGLHGIYVGLSRSRNLKSAEVGEFSSAVIAVLDRHSLEVTGYVPIPWNEIYDIRIARSIDVVTDVMASVWSFERLRQAELTESLHQVAANQVREHQSLIEAMRAAAVAELAENQERAASNLAQAHERAASDLAASGLHASTMETAWKEAHQRAEDLHAQWLTARGEIMKRDARIHSLELVREELDTIKASRSWRWTRLLRFAIRTIQHRGLSTEDRNRLLGAPPEHSAAIETTTPLPSVSVPQQLHVDLQTVKLPAQSGWRRDFFVWAVIDWHFRIQRPQHLARELAAAGHRVFYISNQFNDRAEAGFSVEALDEDHRLFQIRMNLAGSPAIYHAAPDGQQQAQLREGIGMLLAWTRSRACASLIQHPYWLETSRVLPNQRVVYDCMDHHGGFADNTEQVLEREHELMRDADLLVVTSDWLHTEAGKYNPHRMMIRNACQYEHFATPPTEGFRDDRGRKVIGYYGAIAEWFDLDLLEKVARRFSDCLVLMVGADTCGAQRRLQGLGNVEFTGEVPYASLPYYLDGFDVCLLPFQVVPLTLATNPVKVYEYLSAGKEVVSIDLPEMHQFGDLVRTGHDHASFLQALADALLSGRDPQLIARRKQFAQGQTWAHRVHDLVEGIEALEVPRVSVVVVTYNNLDLTKACLDSLARYSDYPNLEIIVVDNASADETPEFLRAWASEESDRHIVLNSDNRGFAAANNQGLASATGDYLVMLNNDTYVTPGWIATLVAHLRRSKQLGMLGPVTNNIGNEARIEISYDGMDEMLERAADYTTRHAGQLTALRTAAFFCVMLPRHVHEKVGSLDEAFGIGFFEDDDYCRRVEQAGWTIACADDVFVHHNLSASFNKLKQETRQALFDQNKVIYEQKWGAWVPHGYR